LQKREESLKGRRGLKEKKAQSCAFLTDDSSREDYWWFKIAIFVFNPPPKKNKGDFLVPNLYVWMKMFENEENFPMD